MCDRSTFTSTPRFLSDVCSSNAQKRGKQTTDIVGYEDKANKVRRHKTATGAEAGVVGTEAK